MSLKFKIIPGYDAYECWLGCPNFLYANRFKVGSVRWTQRSEGRCADTPTTNR